MQISQFYRNSNRIKILFKKIILGFMRRLATLLQGASLYILIIKKIILYLLWCLKCEKLLNGYCFSDLNKQCG